MQVIITSTIFPNSNKSIFSWHERLEQTIGTISCLVQLGYNNIYLIDNSGRNFDTTIINRLAPAKVYVYDQFQYNNKGVSETYLLLNFLKDYKDFFIGNHEPIMKLSGRYLLSNRLDNAIEGFDLAGKEVLVSRRLFRKLYQFSTRCYIAKDYSFLCQYLDGLLEEIFSYTSKIVGYGSLIRQIRNQLNMNSQEKYAEPNLSVEAATSRLIRKKRYRVNSLGTIGLQGAAGTFKDLVIIE